jgi:hypothetical protein
MDQDLEQLMLLRETFKRTGLLHEAQVLQLKYAPLIMTHATKAEFSLDFENKTLIYKLLEYKGKRPIDLDKRCELLVRYTKQLLGDDFVVFVKMNKVKKNVRRKQKR